MTVTVQGRNLKIEVLENVVSILVGPYELYVTLKTGEVIRYYMDDCQVTVNE